MRLPNIRLPRPSVTIPRVEVKRKTITLAFPKIDAKPLIHDFRSFLWKLVPNAVKYKIDRYLHAHEMKHRMSVKATPEYIELDWELAHTNEAEERHLLAAKFLGLDLEETAGGPFFKPVAKYVSVRPRSGVMRGTRVTVQEDGELLPV